MKASNARKVRPWHVLGGAAVSSSAAMTDTTEELSISRMNWLPSGGATTRSAWGSTTSRNTPEPCRPSARPPPVCPAPTASIPARTISIA